MFLNVVEGIDYLERKTTIPLSVDFMGITAKPRSDSGVAFSSGVSLVAQYIESYIFRKFEYRKLKNTHLGQIHTQACAYDEELVNRDIITASTDKYPSCGSIMRAAISKGYVTYTNGVGYISNQVDDIKYFTYQYGGIILEMKATDKTMNISNTPLGYEICSDGAGNVLTDDFTKGFITCGYDSTYLYL